MKYEMYTPTVNPVWSTPNGDELVAEMARVSVIENKGKPIEKLIQYLMEHNHPSPFQMVNLCVEVFAPRDITRQIIRHSSLNFQEFSGRYSEYPDSHFVLRQPRFQHSKNRQMSVDMNLSCEFDARIHQQFLLDQVVLIDTARDYYRDALNKGIAKEQARCLLPEGNTLSRMYINGTLRSWIHYLQVRTDTGSVQREHVQVADAIQSIFKQEFPIIHKAFFEA